VDEVLTTHDIHRQAPEPPASGPGDVPEPVAPVEVPEPSVEDTPERGSLSHERFEIDALRAHGRLPTGTNGNGARVGRSICRIFKEDTWM
jgi:hypothetical protein